MECNLCNFKCDKKSLWERHISSEKHIHIYTIIDNIQNKYDKIIDKNNGLIEENYNLIQQNMKLNYKNYR